MAMRFWRNNQNSDRPKSQLPRSFSFVFSRGDRGQAKIPVKKLRRRLVSPQPTLPHQEIVDLVRKNQLFKVDALLPQALNQVGGLLEGHVAVVVTMDQQDRRLPLGHSGNRRRIKGELDRVPVVRRFLSR